MNAKGAAVEQGIDITDEDEAIAAEWNLTLRRLCGQHGSVIGIYCGQWKLADYCPETKRLMLGTVDSKHAATLFDAIITVGRLAMAGSKSLPSWLRV